MAVPDRVPESPRECTILRRRAAAGQRELRSKIFTTRQAIWWTPLNGYVGGDLAGMGQVDRASA